MKGICFRKTCPGPSGNEGRRPARRGAAAVIVLALFLMFSSIGLALIHLTQISLHAGRAGKNLTVLDILAENGVKQEFGNLADVLAAQPFPLPLDETRAEAWLSDPAAHAGEIIETALGRRTPTSSSGGWEAQTWKAESEFSLRAARPQGSFFEAEFLVAVTSRSAIDNLKATRLARLEAALDIAAGNLPLSRFPVLLDRTAGGGNPPEPPSVEGLEIDPGPGRAHLARALVTEERLLPVSAIPSMERALQVKLLTPRDLTPKLLRRVLGLEESPDPVPEGVYLIRGDPGLGGVYVQGDLRELVLGIEEDAQVLCFRGFGSEWTLKFSPRRNRTELTGPEGREVFNTLPQAVVIVDGGIEALGGGRPDGSGGLRLCSDEEIPSILKGVKLTIVSTGPVTIASHLIHQGVTWERGNPSIKENGSELVIFSGGTGLSAPGGPEGGLFVGGDAPQELKIQAELVSTGAGFALKGPARTVYLLGALQASEIRLGAGRLKVHLDPGPGAGDDSAAAELRTARPVLLVLSLKPRAWSEDE